MYSHPFALKDLDIFTPITLQINRLYVNHVRSVQYGLSSRLISVESLNTYSKLALKQQQNELL